MYEIPVNIVACFPIYIIFSCPSIYRGSDTLYVVTLLQTPIELKNKIHKLSYTCHFIVYIR